MALRWNDTPRQTAAAALKRMRALDIEPLGVIATRVDMRALAAFGHGDVDRDHADCWSCLRQAARTSRLPHHGSAHRPASPCGGAARPGRRVEAGRASWIRMRGGYRHRRAAYDCPPSLPRGQARWRAWSCPRSAAPRLCRRWSYRYAPCGLASAGLHVAARHRARADAPPGNRSALCPLRRAAGSTIFLGHLRYEAGQASSRYRTRRPACDRTLPRSTPPPRRRSRRAQDRSTGSAACWASSAATAARPVRRGARPHPRRAPGC